MKMVNGYIKNVKSNYRSSLFRRN